MAGVGVAGRAVSAAPDLVARLAAAEVRLAALRQAVQALADEWAEWARARSTPRIDAFRDAGEHLRAVLAEHDTPSDPPQDERCTRCHGDQGWHGGHGAWEPCPDCDPPREGKGEA